MNFLESSEVCYQDSPSPGSSLDPENQKILENIKIRNLGKIKITENIKCLLSTFNLQYYRSPQPNTQSLKSNTPPPPPYGAASVVYEIWLSLDIEC